MSATRPRNAPPSIATNAAKGYTLIELLVALAIVALLLGMAIPSFREYTANQRATSIANALLKDINAARGEALRRTDGARIVQAEGGWSAGWRVEAADGRVVSEQASLGQVSLSEAGGVAKIVFEPLGSLASPSSEVSFDICVAVGESFHSARRITLSPSGLAEVRRLGHVAGPCA